MYHQFKQYPNSLRRHRKAAGLRQHEVAHALGLNGCERISKWENGAAIPKPNSLMRLASLYRVSPQELFGEMYSLLRLPPVLAGLLRRNVSRRRDQFPILTGPPL
jgi:transcriptional regulator with XRE-family HTH domain